MKDFDAEIEIKRQLNESHNKYTYFLLAVVGAAITLVVNQTKGASLSWSQLPLAAALVAWALSFFFGCRNRKYDTKCLYTNARLLDVLAGRSNLACTNPIIIQVANEEYNKTFEDSSSKGARFSILQFRFLVAGAVLYLVWHVLEMYLRTI